MSRFASLRPGLQARARAAAQATAFQIDLTAEDSATPWVPISISGQRLSADIVVGSSFTWSSAVVSLEYSLWTNPENANLLSPTVVWTGTTTSKYNIGVASLGHVRWKVTTAEDGNDPAATLIYLLIR